MEGILAIKLENRKEKIMEEYFDVLNEKGEYIGKTETRAKCHKEGLWHKAVVVFIINSKEQVLLQKRSANKRM